MDGQKKEALSTLERALKNCENNWRMWVTFMRLSFENKDFGRFFESVERLVGL